MSVPCLAATLRGEPGRYCTVTVELPFPPPPRDLPPEPRHRVVAALPEPSEAASAIDELVAAGFRRDGIYGLYGEEGLRRLDPTGRRHGFRGRLLRTAQMIIAAGDDIAIDADYIAEGGVVLTVPAANPDEAGRAAHVLKAHGGTHVRYFAGLTVIELS